MKKRLLLLALLLAGVLPAQSAHAGFKFDFGAGAPAAGYNKVTPETAYNNDLGYGFEDSQGLRAVSRGGGDPLRGDFITSDKPPFYFSVRVPEEGNYKVTVTFGDREAESVTTVKAELRRLMVEKVSTKPGEFVTRTFVVNVRRPQVPNGPPVKMREPEAQWETRAWDDKITLEFTNAHPAIDAVEIEKDDQIPTVFLIGDSTVADLWLEPFCAWGQMLPRFFQPGIAIANHAESSETLQEFLEENRLAKVMSVIRPGDYVFIHMGHNDQKDSGPGIGPFTSFASDLRRFVAETRKHGGIPVLMTSIHRLVFDGPKFVDTQGDYPEAVRQVARDEGVPLIDLAASSRILFEALGPQEIVKASADQSHTNDYGAYEGARLVVEGIRQSKLPIARFLVDLPPFDPAHPDPPAAFLLPAEPIVKVTNPY